MLKDPLKMMHHLFEVVHSFEIPQRVSVLYIQREIYLLTFLCFSAGIGKVVLDLTVHVKKVQFKNEKN